MRVAVLGGAGFVGGELLRIVTGHPEVTAWTATSRSQAGRPVGALHPALAHSDAVFSDADPADAARDADVVFLALEHGASSRAMTGVIEAAPRLVVDLAADFRIADPALHARFYGPRPDVGRRFRYALADIEGTTLSGAEALAAPGCFATAAQLALWPIARSGVALAGAPAMFAITGSSGGGRAPREAAHHPLRAHNVFAYGLFAHRHEGEVLERWRAWTGGGAVPRLLVHAGPFVRGIHLTLHARLEGGGAGAVVAAFAEAYGARPFVTLLDGPPELTRVIGTNDAHVHVAAGPDGDEVQVLVALDNLVKGAAGQAVQAANLALGLPEEAGLALAAPWPC